MSLARRGRPARVPASWGSWTCRRTPGTHLHATSRVASKLQCPAVLFFRVFRGRAPAPAPTAAVTRWASSPGPSVVTLCACAHTLFATPPERTPLVPGSQATRVMLLLLACLPAASAARAWPSLTPAVRSHHIH